MNYAGVLLPLLMCWSVGVARTQNPRTEQRPEADPDRVVITTNLVQVDAVVTDKTGRQVTDLRPSDFEVVEGGRTRDIVGFSYVGLISQSPQSAASNQSREAKNKTTPPQLHALRPENVRRAMAILVDDFGLSFESMARLRAALERFISEQSEPSDIFAIVRSSGGPGSMKQFTSDRSRLLATIKGLRWYPTGRGSASAQDSFSVFDDDSNGVELSGFRRNKPPDLSGKEFFRGSLGAFGFVIEGLAKFPGHKSMVVISENLPLTTQEALVSGATNVLDKLIALANQHSIVISTIDARGLPKSGLTVDDSQSNLAANQIEKKLRDRAIRFRVAQDSLNYLAEKTGGIFIHSNNDLNNGLRRIIDSVQGYYLLAFRPDDSHKEGSNRLYKVTLHLKRPDLVLRSRSSFHRFVRTSDHRANQTKLDQLRDALTSPFVSEDVRVKVTALYTGRLQLKVLLHVDSRDITFSKSPEGNYKASFDMAAIAFNDNGRVAQQLIRAQSLAVEPDNYERLLRDGLVYTISLPMQKPGSYQVRMAVRDDDSGRLGSDSQAVEVIESKPSRLSVAGLILQGTDTQVRCGPAVRRFASGDTFEYSYLVYGARDANNSTDLTSQVRLFRGSQEVFKSAVLPTLTAKEVSAEAIIGGGTFRLATELPPGNYFLQIIVRDKSAPLEAQSSTQWIDFEIVK